MPERKQLSLDVVVTRGAFIESRHRVHAAVVHADGSQRAVAGDADLITFWRSCAKPLQVLPFVQSGGVERFGWGTDELALACASHGGEPEHVAVAARMLSTIGLEAGDLACGTHEPMSRRGAQIVRESGAAPSRLHNNCSGKHAAMLARAILGGWPTKGYEHAEHPVQREVLEEIARWTGVPKNAIGVGIDGCGVSVFALPLAAMALAYARLGVSLTSGDEAAGRVVRAMEARPFLLGGTERFDTVLAEETKGRIIAKVGAEGVHSVMVPSTGLGLAVKVEDGGQRAQHAAVLAALVQCGLLTEPLAPRLAEFARRRVKNNRGETVGEIRAENEER